VSKTKTLKFETRETTASAQKYLKHRDSHSLNKDELFIVLAPALKLHQQKYKVHQENVVLRLEQLLCLCD